LTVGLEAAFVEATAVERIPDNSSEVNR
jgi:hypothetical protein